jgi:DNA-binding Xre family transcriptional regulator
MRVLQNRFKELLKEKGRQRGRKITLLEAADAMQLSRKTLESWAKNNLTRFDAFVIIRICEYLDCSVGDLLVLVEIGDSDDHSNDVS